MQVTGNEIRVGDELETWFNRGSAVVKHLRPYTGPLLPDLGEGSQIAQFQGCGVEMTLPAKQTFNVTSRLG